MPGRSSDSPVVFVVGLAVAAIAIVGTRFFGWEFGQPSGSIPIALGIACAVAAGLVWRRR